MRPKRVPNVAARELADGETMLLGADGQQATVLNPLGSVVWSLCDGAHSIEEMAALIGERFADQAREQIAADVRGLLGQLEAAELIRDEDA